MAAAGPSRPEREPSWRTGWSSWARRSEASAWPGRCAPRVTVAPSPWGGANRVPPAARPPLSKQVLSGAWAPERAALVTPQAAAAEDIELRLGMAALSLATDTRQVLLAD